jgi:glyoxylase-like metal-dependent hydrolase (beta-lactamase superfamily II)
LFPGFHVFATRTPTLPPATHTNSLAIGTTRPLLVEAPTPYAEEQQRWTAWVKARCESGGSPLALLVTHHHPDHVGGVAQAQRELGCPVWCHELTASQLGLRADRLLRDGELLRVDGTVLHVLHTPGHAPGHLCLWDPQRQFLFAGDMVAEIGTIIVDPDDGDMGVYLQQLERLAQLEPASALPSHGRLLSQPVALLRHYISHRLGREARVLEALADLGGQAPLDALLSRAYSDKPAEVLPLARRSLLAHLAKLQAEGRVGPRGDDYALRN